MQNAYIEIKNWMPKLGRAKPEAAPPEMEPTSPATPEPPPRVEPTAPPPGQGDPHDPGAGFAAHLAGEAPFAPFEDPEPVQTARTTLIPREKWIAGAQQAFQVPAIMPSLPMLPIDLPIESFKIQPAEQPIADEAFGAFWDICAETEWLHWVIEPHSEWGRRLFVICVFASAKAGAVVKELRGRSAPQKLQDGAQQNSATQTHPEPQSPVTPARSRAADVLGIENEGRKAGLWPKAAQATGDGDALGGFTEEVEGLI